MNNTADLTMTGEASFSNYGNSVSGAGDVNNDGYSDLIVGAHNLNSQTGKSYLYMYGLTGTLISELNMSGDVMMPICLGNAGNGFLFAGLNNPAFSNLDLSFSNASNNAPEPARRMVSMFN